MELLAITTNNLTIVSGTVLFFILAMLLVIILLIAKHYLLPSGNVKITINDKEELEVPTGSPILSTLANEKIFLPSACGGGGSCGQCRLRIVEGGSEPLPTEVVHFSRKELLNGWHLGCQVKVKNDMKIVVPESILGIKKWECEVVSNDNLATFIKEFIVRLPKGEHLDFIPGSYCQIDIPQFAMNYADIKGVDDKFRKDWDHFKMWDLTCKNTEETVRAYSMANYPEEGDIIKLNVRIATPPFDRATGGFMKVSPGIASSYIFSLKPGDKIYMSAPYGDFHPNLDSKAEMIYIGGGAGMAPLRAHILWLLKTKQIRDRKISYWYGARSKSEIFYENDFEELAKEYPNFSFHIALSAPLPEDNWTGDTGFIHDVLYNKYLKFHEAPEDVEYYMCGPGPMSNAVVKMLDGLGVDPESIRYDNFGG